MTENSEIAMTTVKTIFNENKKSKNNIPVKNMPVVIPVFGVHAEILHSLGRVFNKQFQMYVPENRVQNSIFVQPLHGRILRGREGVLFGRFFVKYVPVLVPTTRIVGFATA